MKLFAIAVLLALVGCNGCQHNPPPHTTFPPPGDAAIDYSPPPPGEPATCLDVCRNGLRLRCSWAAATPNGASCVDVCANNQSAGIAPWDLDCRARATDCPGVDRCP